jgi:hypothetical protein
MSVGVQKRFSIPFSGTVSMAKGNRYEVEINTFRVLGLL